MNAPMGYIDVFLSSKNKRIMIELNSIELQEINGGFDEEAFVAGRNIGRAIGDGLNRALKVIGILELLR
jgi:hypothetical protein